MSVTVAFRVSHHLLSVADTDATERMWANGIFTEQIFFLPPSEKLMTTMADTTRSDQ